MVRGSQIWTSPSTQPLGSLPWAPKELSLSQSPTALNPLPVLANLSTPAPCHHHAPTPGLGLSTSGGGGGEAQ